MTRPKFPETGSEDSLETILGIEQPKPNFNEKEETSCKFCRQKWLHWEQRNGRWKLVDREGDVHSCEEYKKHTAAKLNKEFSKNE